MPPNNYRWNHTLQLTGSLNTAVIQPVTTDSATELIVLCHGFGAPGDDLVGIAEPLIRLLQRNGRAPILAFPEAPIDLADFGMPGGRAWWPINMARLMQLAATNDFGEMRDEHPPGLDDARGLLVAAVQSLLDEFSLSPTALTLGGFSQGAMLATDTALRGLAAPPRSLAVMSGALICQSTWSAASHRLAQMQIVQSHGRFDTILPIQTGRWLHEFFRQSSTSVQYHEFDGPHTIPMEILEMLAQ